MGRKQKTIHYLYKTTCTITNRYYIGIHSTCNLEDGYLGSGKRLRRSIRKYGEECHVKEILEFFDCREALIEAEKKAITSDMLTDVNCMNLMSGGTGGFISAEQQRYRSQCGGNVHKAKLETDLEYRERHIKFSSTNGKKLYNDGVFKPVDWTGKKHSNESKQKMSDAKKGKRTGKDSSQFGTMWITNGTENSKVKKEDLLPNGWYKGRV